jgi:hypothetical protein
VRKLLLPVLIATLCLAACKKDIQTEDAVRQGIMNYLSKRSDLTSMDVSVTKVSFRQNEADATVHFQAKNSSAPGTGLDMNYVLERKDNAWVVKGRGAGSGHGAGAMEGSPNPHGMGGVPGMPSPSQMPGQMPTGGLPPGHPALPPAAQPTPPSGHSK